MVQKNKNIGLKSSLIGVVLNILLFVMKLIIGTIFHSVSIVADAMNNFSDLLSSLIAFIGFKMGEKPADKEHPFGHKRFEYISGFLISVVMLYIGLDVLRTGFKSLLNQSNLINDSLMIVVMVISIVIKVFLYFYYHHQYKKLNSDVLLAQAYDSRNDTIISIGILIGLWINKTMGFNVDGILGIVIAAFIIITSVKLLLGFMDELVGKRPSQKLINDVIKVVDNEPSVFSYHDLLIHEYGDHTYFGSIHLEVDERLSLNHAHEIADLVESNVKSKTGVNIVVHLDPIDTTSDEIKSMHLKVKKALKSLDERFSFHDLRIVEEVMELDVVLFEDNPYAFEEIETQIKKYVNEKYQIKVTFDRVQLKDNISVES